MSDKRSTQSSGREVTSLEKRKLMFSKKLEDLSVKNLWLWNWADEFNAEAMGYARYYDAKTQEYSMYCPKNYYKMSKAVEGK